MQTKIPVEFGFYAILTDPLRGYEYLTELLVEHRIAFVQLRMKESPLEAIEAAARAMRTITSGSSTRLIVNDFPALAKKVGADGVHLGQSDMRYPEARDIVGQNAIIGISTHSSLQTIAACSLRPDYIGVGPVFPTPTKKNPDPVIGIPTMKEMLSLSTAPAVAIGGISLKTLPAVLEAGARNFCMVRPINQASNPEKVLKEILKVYRDFRL
jgi:thiamine-phosphate pyrophosphorylase